MVVGGIRVGASLLVIAILLWTYAGRVAVGDGNPFDYFGYFANQSSLLSCLVLGVSGILTAVGRVPPGWLSTVRAVSVACLIIVAVIYNTLVPGTGTAPPWVSAILHIWFPLLVVLDWLLVGDRGAQRWALLWTVVPYPVVWLIVVLVRGVTDGWVPYGFLLPERGIASLLLHVVGLLLALGVAGALVWAASRFPGVVLRREVDDSPSRGGFVTRGGKPPTRGEGSVPGRTPGRSSTGEPPRRTPASVVDWRHE